MPSCRATWLVSAAEASAGISCPSRRASQTLPLHCLTRRAPTSFSPLRLAVAHRPGRGRRCTAAQALVGTHDFRSFQTSGSPAGQHCPHGLRRRRRPRAAHHRDLIHIEVEADGFLYNMVRAIVGTLVEVGRGVKAEGWPAEVLAAGDRRAAGKPPRRKVCFCCGSSMQSSGKLSRVSRACARVRR